MIFCAKSKQIHTGFVKIFDLICLNGLSLYVGITIPCTTAKSINIKYIHPNIKYILRIQLLILICGRVATLTFIKRLLYRHGLASIFLKKEREAYSDNTLRDLFHLKFAHASLNRNRCKYFYVFM